MRELSLHILDLAQNSLTANAKRWYFEAKKSSLCEKVSIVSFDGLTLKGLLFKSEKPTDKAVICFHGYTSWGDREYCHMTEFFHGLGFDVLVIDQRAHGKSDGQYITFGINDRIDAVNWCSYLAERKGASCRIYLHGISMGCATVLMAADAGLPSCVKGIIGDCGYSSVPDIMLHVTKMKKGRRRRIMHIFEFVCRHKCGWSCNAASPADAMAKNKTLPVLFIHGEKDDFVPMRMTMKNYEACNAPKALLIVKGAGHGESYYKDPVLYRQAMLDFLVKLCGEKL